MRSTTHLVVPDPHSHFQHHNLRAEWLGSLIADVKPDTVIIMGDTADMPSLCSYDKGKKAFQGRTYQQDLEAHADFQERLWGTVRKQKKRMPRRITLIGNHEERISRAIETQPELEGVISYDDLDLKRYYDEVVEYEGATPGVIEVDGVHYAHFLVAGISGRPVGGERAAVSLLAKNHSSCTVAHSHLFDFAVRTRQGGKKIFGLVAGCYQDWRPGFAGTANDLWWSGVHIKRDVEEGTYNLQSISIDRLRREYGGRNAKG